MSTHDVEPWAEALRNLEDGELTLTPEGAEALVIYVRTITALHDRSREDYAHLRAIPCEFAGVYRTKDGGSIPIDGRIVHFLLDELQRHRVAVSFLDSQAARWRDEAEGWREELVDEDYEGET